jgi:N-acetylneuraminic acid mutarotase
MTVPDVEDHFLESHLGAFGTLDERIYILDRDDTALSFEHGTQNWHRHPYPPVKPDLQQNCFGIGGRLYVSCEGQGDYGVTDPQLFRLDPDSDGWEDLGVMPMGRFSDWSGFGARLYTFGSYGQTSSPGDVWEYDTQLGSWAQKNPLPVDLANPVSVTCNNRIYVLGNEELQGGNYHVFEYDPSTDSYLDHIHPYTPQWYSDGVSLNGVIYLQGCQGLYAYDPVADSFALVSGGFRGFLLCAFKGVVLSMEFSTAW